MRCSGLGEADAGLITIRELDTGRFERAADRKFISNGEGSPQVCNLSASNRIHAKDASRAKSTALHRRSARAALIWALDNDIVFIDISPHMGLNTPYGGDRSVDRHYRSGVSI